MKKFNSLSSKGRSCSWMHRQVQLISWSHSTSISRSLHNTAFWTYSCSWALSECCEACSWSLSEDVSQKY